VKRDQWQETVALFEEALARAPEERDRFLEAAARDDPELRARVAAMLRADSAPHAIFDATPNELVTLLPGAAAAGLANVGAVPRPDRRRWLPAAVGGGVLIIAMAAWLVARTGAEARSVAVLPFANLSGGAAAQRLSDSLTDELTRALASVGELRVAPRQTADAYKGRSGDIARIGAELGVTRVLEGSVRVDGVRVRVSASLYDVRTGEQLWRGTYDRTAVVGRSVQAELADSIAERVTTRIGLVRR
jgi:TolB-like protein